jgi:hypothetical protein
MGIVSPLLTRLKAFRRPKLDILKFLEGFLNESARIPDEDFPLIFSVNLAWFVTNAVRQHNGCFEGWTDSLVFEEALTDASAEFEEFLEDSALDIRHNLSQDWEGLLQAFYHSLETSIRYHARLHEPINDRQQLSFSYAVGN